MFLLYTVHLIFLPTVLIDLLLLILLYVLLLYVYSVLLDWLVLLVDLLLVLFALFFTPGSVTSTSVTLTYGTDGSVTTGSLLMFLLLSLGILLILHLSV